MQLPIRTASVSRLSILTPRRGRIVNISSVNGKLSFPFSSFYAASKFALEALSDALRAEVQPWGIDDSVVEPGTTQTDIRARGAAGWRARHESLAPEERVLYERTYERLQYLIPQVDSGAADHHYVIEAVIDALTAQCPSNTVPRGS